MRRILQVGPRGLLLTGVAVALALAVAALFPGATAEASENDGGEYVLVLDCDTHSAKGNSFEFTQDGTGQGAISLPSEFECDAGGLAGVSVTASAQWNDFTFEYECPKGTARTLDVPAPDAEVDEPYDLTCESPGATIEIASLVGGIAELPPLAGTSAEEAGAPTDGSGWSAGAYAALAGSLAAAALALGGGAWYARRRWIR